MQCLVSLVFGGSTFLTVVCHQILTKASLSDYGYNSDIFSHTILLVIMLQFP